MNEDFVELVAYRHSADLEHADRWVSEQLNTKMHCHLYPCKFIFQMLISKYGSLKVGIEEDKPIEAK